MFLRLTESKKLKLELVFLVLSLITLLLGIKFFNIWLLILAGFWSGLYYGRNNDRIWHFSYVDEYYRKLKKENEKPQTLNPVAKAHQVWIHVLCGAIAGLTLYLLLARVDFCNSWITLKRLELKEFVLFFISILGYTGLLPRTLWFFASRGDIKNV